MVGSAFTYLALMKLSSGLNSTLYRYYSLFILLVISEKLVAWPPPSTALPEPYSVVSSSYMLFKRKSMPPASLRLSGYISSFHYAVFSPDVGNSRV